MKKTVTVSLPVFNGKMFVLDALNSVVNQTVKVDKIIICDNLSDDGTVNIVENFISIHKNFDIDLIVNKGNIGFQKNFIKCYELAETDYLVILHVDDLLKPDAIERQLDFFSNNSEFAVVGSESDFIDEQGSIKHNNWYPKDLFFRKGQIYEFIKATSSYIPFSSVMYNLELTKDVMFFEEESMGPDELYWPLLLKKHSIAILCNSLIENRVYEGQMHIKNSIEKFDKYINHFANKLDRANLETTKERQIKTRKVIKQQISKISLKLGEEILQSGDNYKVAFKYYWHGISQDKGILFSKDFVKSIIKVLKPV